MSQDGIICLLKEKGPMRVKDLSFELEIGQQTICKSIRKLEMRHEIIHKRIKTGARVEYFYELKIFEENNRPL